MNKETFLKYEPKLAKFFLNSRKQNRLSHAYLLYGENNAPLKEVALFLAQSLSCERDLLACGECPSCQRFEKGIHPDFRLIDGKLETIKKESIKSLLEGFSLSALEKGHVLCYVINEVDNITEEAANTLLKFLEEPKEGQIAFLTSTNPTRVLKTIRSRSLLFRVETIDPLSFYHRLEKTEFLDEKGKRIPLSATALYFLSKTYSSSKEIRDMLLEDPSFLEGFADAEMFLNELAHSLKGAKLSLLESNHRIKDSKCYNWLYRTLLCVFQEALFPKENPENPFREIELSLSQHDKALLEGIDILEKALRLRQINLSPTALCARLIQRISEEY